jgi:imidazolonepropionase-like amidohydrolase
MSEMLVLRGAEIADARGGRAASDIVVRSGRISEIVPAGQARADGDRVRELDVSGATVVPGLVNMHSHFSFAHPGSLEEAAISGESPSARALRMAANALKALRAGVTSARLVGEADGLEMPLIEAIGRGDLDGPRLWTASAPLTFRNGHGGAVGAVAGDSPADYAALTQQQLDRGATLIKVVMCPGGASGDLESVRMSADEFAEIRRVARQAGVKIAVHTSAVPHPIMDMLLEDGLDTLEHCYRQSPEMLGRAIDRNMLLVMTPLVGRSPEYFAAIELPQRLQEGIIQASEPHWQAVREAVQEGARLALGTDFLAHLRIGGTWAVVRELELYEEAGVEPERLLALASRNGAEWLGQADELGLVQDGFLADLLVLERNPLEHGARAFRDLRLVIAGGRVHEPSDPEVPGREGAAAHVELQHV